MPLPGDLHPTLMTVECSLSVEAEEHCERILRAIISKPVGEEQDIEDELDPNLPFPFEDENVDAEGARYAGWIQLEWENKTRYVQ